MGKLTFGDKTYSNYVLSFRFPENQQNIEWFMIPHVEWDRPGLHFAGHWTKTSDRLLSSQC